VLQRPQIVGRAGSLVSGRGHVSPASGDRDSPEHHRRRLGERHDRNQTWGPLAVCPTSDDAECQAGVIPYPSLLRFTDR
jgi:hypothetical protein